MDVMQVRPAPLGLFFCTFCRVFTLNWEQGEVNRKREIVYTTVCASTWHSGDSTRLSTKQQRGRGEKIEPTSWPRLESLRPANRMTFTAVFQPLSP
ncbi:hypothetical protein DFH08DRAFT_884843 [Mycena albidolilacea]|uniref:Uncharacterized protein n=1 Tax=Mycena albidolilacea TaxID=1033008 RepID=A0AAD6ZKQ0_9AGAR|nr:hypothetical protein DFH08DRAFT_884843 [Mycena albidolilacea]